ncbi:hemagglutinin repeat-containing protein [Stenotrophomonas mori]|uniref:Hemagglutinin repeat-containing protein n=1 Tax=Stenotrophomonas mori TaxID=2871096 RepID=A0ABT0SHJ6_9GAMM|nr:hemagglutinin repeat-containing protein [Stenotrophomonas mori]MCL7714454.1 hemagglutinin repeat-containing protein [Stenotrophomonas mori]
MNRIYRLVFNRILGVWQVASELVKAAHGGADSGTGVSTALLRPVSFALWLALGWVGLAAPLAAAPPQARTAAVPGRIVGDRSAPPAQRPTVVTSANGTPQVNITTPSAAGVSRNSYRHFDVGSDGVILNNARNNVQTQLGGWVQGNPYLARGTARIILNEVNSADPSQLRGYVEVAGDRAQVVIANPSGIQVDGGGFLNASRVTLTTGTPIVTAGVLDGYRVDGGRIGIGGAGLDASRVDYTDIITRALDINAGLWADRLQASLGRNTVSADHGRVTAHGGGDAAPALALDVGALGGMYANRIWLVGNEHGVGVRNAGSIGAQAGELVVTVDGRLENTGALHSQQDARVAARGGIANSGTISAAREARLDTAADLDNSGGTLNALRLDLQAASLRNHGGAIEQVGAQDLYLQAAHLRNRDQGRIGTLAQQGEGEPGPGEGGATSPGGGSGGGEPGTGGGAGGGDTPGNGLLAAGRIAIHGVLDNSAGRLVAGGDIDATSHGLDNSDGNAVVRDLHVEGDGVDNQAGSLAVQRTLALDAERLDNRGGRLEVADHLEVRVDRLDNRDGRISHAGEEATALRVAGLLDNHGGMIASNAVSLDIQADRLDNGGGELRHSGRQGLTLKVDQLDGRQGRVATAGALHLTAGQVDHRGADLSAEHLQLEARTFDNRGGSVLATGSGSSAITVRDALDNSAGGLIAGNGDLALSAHLFGNAGGAVQQAGDGLLSIAAFTLLGREGSLLSNGTLTITGSTTDLRGATTSAQRINIATGDLTTAGGQLIASGGEALQLTALGTLDNRGGVVGSNGVLAIQAQDIDNHEGRISTSALGASTVAATATLDNHGGEIVSAGDLSLAATALDNRGGSVAHAGTGLLSIAARTLDGAGGTVLGNGELQLEGGTIDLRGGTTQAARIEMKADALTTAEGILVATSEERLRLRIRDALDNEEGLIAGNGALELSAGALSNRAGGIVASGQGDTRIDIAGLLDNTGGTVETNARVLDIQAARLSNERGTVAHAGDELRIATGALLGNHGTLSSAGALVLHASDVAHRQAQLSAVQLTIDTASLDNAGGRIIATGEQASSLTVTGLFDNGSGGTLAGNGDLSIHAGTFGNAGGTVQHAGEGELRIDAATLQGAGGTLLGNGTLLLSGDTLDLRDGTTSARHLAVEAGDLTTAGGQLVATGDGALALHVLGKLDNREGTIASNGVIDLHAGNWDNRQGLLQSAAQGHSALTVAGQIDNEGGAVLFSGDARIDAGSLSNRGGTVQAAGAWGLRLTVEGRLDNSGQGILASAGDLEVGAGALDNHDGTLGAGTVLDVQVEDAVDNTGGTLQAGEGLTLQADGLDNTGGTIVGAAVQVDTRGRALDNTRGLLASSAGALDIHSGALQNIAGLLQSAGDLSLDASGKTIANRQSGDAGGIVSGGLLDLRGGTLDNRGGVVSAQADAQLAVGELDNTAAGLLSSGRDLEVWATSLSNAGGTVQAGGGADLVIGGDLRNRGGLIAAAEALTVSAATVDNRDTLAATTGRPLGLQADSLQVVADRLDNRNGQLIADSQARIEVQGLLDNGGGQVSSRGQLDIGADAITNTGGTLVSGGDQTLVARVLGGDGALLSRGDLTVSLQQDFTNSGEVSASGTVALTTAGRLVNRGRLQGGSLALSADSIDNAVDGEISAADRAFLDAAHSVVNRGLIDAGTVHVDTRTLDNLGTGRIYGDHVALAADTLHNRAETIDGSTVSAVIAAREQLDLGARVLANTGEGLIYSGGAAAIGGALDGSLRAVGSAERVDNIGSVIDIADALTIDAGVLSNVRENVEVTQTTTIKAPVRLDQPAWHNNGRNDTYDIRSTSNYQAYEVYYLDPADILEDTPYITPDGYHVRKAVVRLTPQTTAYFFGRGGLHAASGERSRLYPQDGTITLYYFGRQNGQANPDQVAIGADDPFLELTGIEPGSPAFHYVDDTLTYSSAYGTCTTNCVQIWAPHAYNDPGRILIHPQGIGGSGLENNEKYRVASGTVTDDVLVPGIGADAVIRTGGKMSLTVDELVNHYGQVVAGGDLDLFGHGAQSHVENLGLTLYRTHSFDNVSYGYNGSTRHWSRPSISEEIGKVGGSIVAGGTLTVDVGDLSNLDKGRDAPNVRTGAALAGLGTHAEGSELDTSGPAIQGPARVGGRLADAVASDLPAAVAGNGGAGATGPGRQAADGAARADGTSVDGIAMGAVDTHAPGNSLFTVAVNGNGPLVETDPRFADYRNWLDSDYLLSKMGLDPANTHKRLGDGFYEQKLVREQIGELTGRRFLEGHANDEDQYRALLEAGATFAQAYGLRPGVALSAEQMAQLTSDIVWLVEQTITLADGSTTTALVPQVYLRVRPGDLNDSGALLAGTNVDLRLSGDMVNEGNIAGRQQVRIEAENIRNQAGARIEGRTVGLKALQDIDITGSQVRAGEALDVVAGGDITVASTQRTHQGAGLDATVVERVAGLYVTGGGSDGGLRVSAGGDVTLLGAQVRNAGDGLTALAAGGDLNLETLTVRSGQSVSGDERNYRRSEQVGHVASAVQGGGSVLLHAGNDVNLAAAGVAAGDALVIQAGRDITSTVVVDTSTVEQGEAGKRWSTSSSATDETVRGSTLQAGGDIALAAGRDATLTAAGVYSEEGGIALAAGRDVSLLSAQEQHDLSIDEQRTKKGFLKRKTTTTHDEWHESLAVGSTLSGESVQVAAGRDLIAQAAQIAGTGDVLLAAGRDLTLTTAENTYSEVHDKTVKKSGLFGSGGVGFTIGKQQTDTEADVTGVTHSGSTVGSLEGDVTLVAGNALSIAGSDVVALEGNITAKAKSIAITEVHDTSTAGQQTRFKQGGLTVAVSAPVLSLLQTADDLNKASKQSGGDGRMQALAAGAAALNAYNSAGALSELGQGLASGNAGDMAKSANVSVSATIGGSKSENQSKQSSSMTKGSTLQAGGDVTLIATGGGQDSNIVVRGSDISAGNDLLLLADNAITLESAQDTAEQHSSSKSSSAAIGVAATIGSGGTSFGITASASAARGNADGEDVSQRNTHVSAGNTATVISGGDTTIKGAQLSAERVVADIGGDLNIESLQDTSTYDSKSQSAGGSVTVGAGFSGSASYSSSKVSGDYASVGEQSGIFAGDGGFDIRVEGNTDLKGAVIASTQEAVDTGMNRLQTGTLTYSDIENHSDYSAKSVSLSGGYSAGGSKGGDTGSPSTTNNGSDWSWQNFNTGAQGAAAGYGSKSGSDSSTTHSGISGGSLVITDQAGQQERTGQTAEEVLAGLNRGVISGDDADGLSKAWDGQQLQQQVEAQAQITAVFGQQASKAVGDFASKKALELRLQGNEEEAAKWDEGGAYRVAAHTVMGALGGGLEGALGSGSAAAAAPYLTELTSHLPDGVKEAVGAGLAAGLGAAVGGGSGASMAFNEDANNRMLHPDAVKWIREHASEFAEQQGISEQEAYRILLVEGAAYVDQGIQDKLAHLGSYDNEAAIEFLLNNQDVYGNLAAFDGDHRNVSMFDNELGRSTQEFIDVFNTLAATAGTKDDWHMVLAPANNAFADASASQWGVAKLQAASAVAGILAAGGVAFYPMLPEWAAAGAKGASISSSIYAGTVAGKATSETWEGGSFLEAYGDNFSWARLGISATTGAVGGMYTQQMLMWSGVPVGFFPSIKTAGGLVIRVNSMLKSAAVSKAANAVVDQHENNVNEEDK